MNEEDETRKEMIDFISVYIKAHGCTGMNKWITYLEKQGEQKQVEWSEDDEQYLLVCKNALEKYEVSDKWDSTIIMQWLKEKLKRPVKTNFRERYKRISESEWFKKTHEGMSVSEEPDNSYCQEHCKGFKETGKCFADSACSAKIEAETIDKAEPKFHEGDWIVFNGLTLYIKEVVKGFYRTISKGDNIPNSYDWDIDNIARLWTIQDAKKGDVLEFGDHGRLVTGIVSHINKTTGKVDVSCLLEGDKFKVGVFYNLDTVKPHPATKEQRDILFVKMKEAGYEWDAEKKEPKKIVAPKFNIHDCVIKKHNSNINDSGYFIITDITDGKYWYNDRIICDITEQDELELYEPVRQKPTAWSEEDEKHVNSILIRLEGLCRNEFLITKFAINEDEDWLKSLKERIIR